MCMKSTMIRQSGSVNSVCIESIICLRIRDVNQELLAFCTRPCMCKKYKIDVKRRQSEALAFYTWLYACKNIR
jgi:hypothetical protein